MYKMNFTADLGGENLYSTFMSTEAHSLNIPHSNVSRGLQPRSFEGFLPAVASGMPSASSTDVTNYGILANMIHSSSLTNPVVISSYDVNNSLFQWLMVKYSSMTSVTDVSTEVYCPTVPAGTKLAMLGLRTTSSTVQNVKFSTVDTITTPAETSGTFTAPPTSGFVHINGGTNYWSTEIGYCYSTATETLTAYNEWANNPGAPTMEWPTTVYRLTADGFVFDPARQLGLHARPSVTVLPCKADVIGFYQPLDDVGAYALCYASQREFQNVNVKLNSFIDQDPVASTSNTSDAHPFNCLLAVGGQDVKQHKPICFGSVFDHVGRPYNYFVSGIAAQRLDRTDSTSAYPKQSLPDDYFSIALGWMLSPNQLLYWGDSNEGRHLSGIPLSNVIGQHGDVSRNIPVVPAGGVARYDPAKFGVKVDSNLGQGMSNVIDFESSLVNGKLELRALGELDAILAIGSGLGIKTFSGYVVATNRNNNFGSVGWTS